MATITTNFAAQPSIEQRISAAQDYLSGAAYTSIENALDNLIAHLNIEPSSTTTNSDSSITLTYGDGIQANVIGQGFSTGNAVISRMTFTDGTSTLTLDGTVNVDANSQSMSGGFNALAYSGFGYSEQATGNMPLDGTPAVFTSWSSTVPTLLGNLSFSSTGTLTVNGDSETTTYQTMLVSDNAGHTIQASGLNHTVTASPGSPIPDLVQMVPAMLAGNDTATGSDGADELRTYAGDDSLLGMGGNDRLIGGDGNDSLEGGQGVDVAVYSAYLSTYVISATATGHSVADAVGTLGTDTLNAVERLQFSDAHLALDIDGDAGQVYRLYKAAFARTPDLPGLGSWIAAMDGGHSLEAVANAFVGSPEFQNLYGANTSNDEFVTLLYLNALGRAPGAGEVSGWASQITAGAVSRAQVLAQFSESVENKAAVAGKIANGILYASSEQTTVATQGQTLTGSAGADSLHGTVARDSLNGLAGNDALDGGAGVDTAIYSGARADYVVSVGASGLTVSSGSEGTDTLIDIERLQFSDGALAFDIDGNAGQVYRLYQAAFNRTPDMQGLTDWIRGMDQGMTLQQVASGFIGSNEFQSRYGANPNDAIFVELLYQNVLNREPDPDGEAYWLDVLDRGLTREMALIGFSESTENQLAVIGVIQDGIQIIPG